MSKTYEQVRLQAKELGIKNWHTKKLERLEAEVSQMNEDMSSRSGGMPDGTVSKVSFGQLLDILDDYAMSSLTDAFDALDNISKASNGKAVQALDQIFNSRPHVPSEVSVDWMYERVLAVSGTMMSKAAFSKLLESVCKLYAGRGWYIDLNENILMKPNKPVFRLDWHVKLWQKSDSNRNTVYRMLAILSQPEQEVQEYEQKEAI
jgi:hypothetical protein